jgi:hypothetical protein
LVLFCVVGSVNAITDYYVVIEGETESSISSTLNATTWLEYTPSIESIQGNVIYFTSETDLVRFLISPGFGLDTQAPLYSYGLISASDDYTIVYGYALAETLGGNSLNTMTVELNNDELTYTWLGNAMLYYDAIRASVLQNDVTITSQEYTDDLYEYFQRNSPVNTTFTGKWQSLTTASARGGMILVMRGDLDLSVSKTSANINTYSTLIESAESEVMIYTDVSSVEIYDSGYLIGTTDNAGCINLSIPIGDHTLTFSKTGYWDLTQSVTIVAEDNSEIFISLSPKTSIFQVSKEFSGNLYPNSVGTLSMDINPVKGAYASKLRVSGVELNKVYYKTQELPKGSDGYYILGDVTSTQNIEIDFKTPSSWGEKTFTVELSATDIEGTAYTNLETIDYEVLELPFLLEMPETFGIGLNDITLTDQSGTAYSVLMVLYDSEGTETWSSSTNLLEYCDYTFEVPVDDAGDYTLELNAKSGTVKTYYSIDIIEPVTLITEEITVNPGNVATVQFKISNPTSSVKYYTAELTCPFFNESINKTFSIAPETVDKTVDMSFEVPEELELENYQLTLEIFDPDKTDAIYSGSIVLTISESSLFLASVPGGNTTLILLAAAVLLIVGTFAALRLKK